MEKERTTTLLTYIHVEKYFNIYIVHNIVLITLISTELTESQFLYR